MARGDITATMSLSLVILDMFNSLVDAEFHSSRRRELQVTAEVQRSRSEVRDRLAAIVKDLSSLAPASSTPAQFRLLQLLTAAPCELSKYAVDIATTSLQASMQKTQAPDSNAIKAANNLMWASDPSFCPEPIQPACLNSCHNRGSCVNGACNCVVHECIEARCYLEPIARSSNSCDGPLPDYCDSNGQCYNVSCSRGLCHPSSTVCREGFCVPNEYGGDACYIGPYPS